MQSSGLAWIHLGAGVLIAAPLAYAGASKLLEPHRFVAALAQYRIGLPIQVPSALLVATLELLTAGCLLIARSWISGIAAMVAYLVLAIILDRARRTGASGDCGCFGHVSARIDGAAVLRNLGLAGIALLLALARATEILPNYSDGAAVIAGGGLLLLTGVSDTLMSIRALRRDAE